MSTTESVTKLKPVQLAALVILMAEAREVSNQDFDIMAKFTLTGTERSDLEKLGLIESRKVGRTLAFQLTDKGWLFCKQLHATDVNVGRSIAARSIFVLLDGLHRSLERLRVSHAEFFKQSDEPAPEKHPVVTTGADVEDRIRAAYEELPKAPGGWVGLADLRGRLGDLDRSAVDEGLRALLRQDGVRIIPAANTKALKPRDHAAALRIGDEDNHALLIGRT
jgi:hypothetical protein